MKIFKEVLFAITMGVEQLVLQNSARLIQHTASASFASILSTGAATLGIPTQYSNLVVLPSFPAQYSNRVFQPSIPIQCSNLVFQPSFQTQFSNLVFQSSIPMQYSYLNFQVPTQYSYLVLLSSIHTQYSYIVIPLVHSLKDLSTKSSPFWQSIYKFRTSVVRPKPSLAQHYKPCAIVLW